MSLMELFRPKPALGDPDRSNGKKRRHIEAYRALNELCLELGLRFDETTPFDYGMGVEDLYEKLGTLARAATAELKKR